MKFQFNYAHLFTFQAKHFNEGFKDLHQLKFLLLWQFEIYIYF